jgi:hypothetical protein
MKFPKSMSSIFMKHSRMFDAVNASEFSNS